MLSRGQGLAQFAELGLAFGLSALAGLEREARQKAAGLRTIVRRLPRLGRGPATLRVLEACTGAGFSVAEVSVDPEERGPHPGVVDVVLTVYGRPRRCSRRTSRTWRGCSRSAPMTRTSVRINTIIPNVSR